MTKDYEISNGDHTMPWKGVEFKIDEARFFLDQMRKDLIAPRHDRQAQGFVAPMESSGAIVDHPWQNRFYYHLDAFLAASRSIPEVIQASFGIDKKSIKKWPTQPDAAEMSRREQFQKSFSTHFEAFNKLVLTRIRVATFHYSGIPSVEVKIKGQSRTAYQGI